MIARYFKKALEYSRLIPIWEEFLWQKSYMEASASSRLSDLRSLCFMVGPNRNLASLVALLIYLHKNGEAVNHAGSRIFPKKEIDIWHQCSENRFDLFCRYLEFLSSRGMRGQTGGSIRYSNAVADHPEAKQLVLNRFPDLNRRSPVHALVWKEPLMIYKFLASDGMKTVELLKCYQKIKLLLPVRNPLDCAISNKNLGERWLKRAYGLTDFSLESVLEALFKIYHSFFTWSKTYPGRCMALFENECSENTLSQLAQFLSLEHDPAWIVDCLQVWKVNQHYRWEKSWLEYYKILCDRYFSDVPEIKNRFLLMVGS